jgi:hypothetical protein
MISRWPTANGVPQAKVEESKVPATACTTSFDNPPLTHSFIRTIRDDTTDPIVRRKSTTQQTSSMDSLPERHQACAYRVGEARKAAQRSR